mmetsp:Transcript_20242/g.52248  ORF Transcript_20242/g.52248 Transcript_20242/m.52248 type:complete len:96 (+) Transcript_20242:53-340(+)
MLSAGSLPIGTNEYAPKRGASSRSDTAYDVAKTAQQWALSKREHRRRRQVALAWWDEWCAKWHGRVLIGIAAGVTVVVANLVERIPDADGTAGGH